MLRFCFKKKTAYEMRIRDWSSDVCSSDLRRRRFGHSRAPFPAPVAAMKSPIAARLRADAWVAGNRVRKAWKAPGSSCRTTGTPDRTSVVSGKSWSVRVDFGGRRTINKKQKIHNIKVQ